MTLTLEQKIESALAAQQKVEELRHLEVQAAELPKLLKQQQDQEWIEAVRPVMEQRKQLAAQQLTDTAAKMREWRKDFLASYAHLVELVNALPELHRQIYSAAEAVQQVASTRAEIDQRQGTKSDYWFDHGGFAELWAEVGGRDDNLCPLPSGIRERYHKWEPLIKLLANRQFILYSPEDLIKEYRDKVERRITQ